MRTKRMPILVIGLMMNMFGILLGNFYKDKLPYEWIPTALIFTGCVLLVIGVILIRKKK